MMVEEDLKKTKDFAINNIVRMLRDNVIVADRVQTVGGPCSLQSQFERQKFQISDHVYAFPFYL